MPNRQPPLPRNLPALWLVSDARNDAALRAILARLPRRSALIIRHYHLDFPERMARFEALRRIARRYGHLVVLSAPPRLARARGADGAYGPPDRLARRGAGLRLATAHNRRELAAAQRIGADAVLLSPVFATRGHPAARPLGPVRWRLLARSAAVPVIALGGMTARRARAMGARSWAAIDGLAQARARNPTGRFPVCS